MKSYNSAKIVMRVVMGSQRFFRVTKNSDGTWNASYAWCEGYGMTKHDAIVDCRSRMMAWRLGEAKGRVVKKVVDGTLQWVKR